MSYIAMRELPSHISNLVFSQMVKLNTDREEGKSNPSIESCLTAGFMSGMGSDRYFDAMSSVLSCARGAQAGITGLRAIVVRLAKVAGATVQENMEKTLQWNAERGSLAAMEELREISPEKAERAKVFMQRHGCGVGARFFSKVLGPFTYPQLSDLTVIDSHLRKTGQTPRDIIVNPRGDTLIHAAASMGSKEVVLALLDRYKVPVNVPNAQEETPLLCAMRAGHVEVVIGLLDRGANAGSISKNRETALHWLISISESCAREILSGLIENGADIHNPRWALNCEYAASMISGYLSRWDHPEAGSPLHWAVSRKRKDLVALLLEHGADHYDRGDFATNTTAFEQAAYFHDHEILRIIIDSKYPRPRVPSFDTGFDQNFHNQRDEVPGGSYLCGPSGLIRQAIEGSDRYLMAVRWGAAYKKQLQETFQLLGEELRYVELIRGVDQAGRSPLQYAASRGFHEAAECIYEYMDGPRWLNVPYDRDGGITPIFESVKRDNKTLFNFLLSKRAKIDIRIDSPGMRNRFDWCILHTVAQYGDAEVADKILGLGIPPDGYCVEGQEPTETPLAVAIENNNFEVADYLRERGADVNALSQWSLNSNLRLSCPMTILGRIIASNLRDYKRRLKYLLGHERRDLAQPTFVVAPAQRLTALHVSVLGVQALHADHQQERDDLVASRILDYLLELFDGDEQINAVTADGASNTALHIAVHSLNVRAVELLLTSDFIRLDVQAANGLSAIHSARKVVTELERDDKQKGLQAREILDMLLEKEQSDQF
ncbi:hypothetical protein AYO22_08137 [Fonsecaea multimorphosa]|nr:hypothetical protein AYO22_08137 [Fonsecaea multimorphosa]